METIRFAVDKQCIKKIETPYLVAGTKNYLQAAFTFDSTWSGFKKVAVFNSKYYRPIVNGKCVVPEEVTALHRFSVGVVGDKDGVRITTNTDIIDQG